MQLYRITTHYGEALAPAMEETKCLHPLSGKEECVYAMADGNMVLTSEDNWKEVKPGRIFSEKACWQAEGTTNSIRASQYVSHLGDSQTFTSKWRLY